jgi:iron(III) transport system substrate-binding protein
VVVYAALDREFSQPVFAEFTRQTGIRVRAKYDTESTKTVQLTTAIIAERSRPRCDLFWNNEILNTLRLGELRLLAPYRSRWAADYPPEYRAADGTWYGFAARARVLLVNSQLVPEEQLPNSVLDLASPRWQGKVGIAKPLFGTTRTHAVCLFQHLGEAAADQFFATLASRAQVLSGNKQVALAVGRGQLAFGLTDTDDAVVELEKGQPVQIVYPDQGPGQMGTLFIPNTLAVLRGGPHPRAARRLLDFLLSAEIESRLTTGRSAQIPLNRQVTVSARVETPRTIRPLSVDVEQALEIWDEVGRRLMERFATAGSTPPAG